MTQPTAMQSGGRGKWLFLVGVVVVAVGGLLWSKSGKSGTMLSPEGDQVVRELPYAQYAFERLVMREDGVSQIEVDPSTGSGQGTFSYLSEGKTITGAITKPEGEGPFPVIIMLRGYVDKEIYTTGMGTQNAAKYYSEQGYATLAPDFLGYGGSDPEDENSLGARVRRPVAVLDLLASLASLEMVDISRVYLWGHSNGGQIALSVLEILGQRKLRGRTPKYELQAATLWAPVSRPFPYSILYYTYDWDPPSPDGSGGAGDQGKALRKALAKFEEDYDVFEYSVATYWDWIRIPIQVHQGTADEAVPVSWSDELVETLEGLDKEIEYYRYSGVDHNMRPSWSTVIARDVAWFGNW